ncbi:ARP2/3 actin-organizing complex subunit Sop2 [Mucor velutinosus]|uniref:ARP2/3 actin-organizing complex subunit Sop2 n=1 Tax=Mucor velutinosus TaxID=708070 RepID=A0AAN7DA05_9FUNG|nr:ARP2/3 actin-organizing complex subunit Sop2 [Mucor velutinosus]
MTIEESGTGQSDAPLSTSSSNTSSVFSAEMSIPNQQVVIVTGESNVKPAPKFHGSGFSVEEDPLQFLEDFKEAASWNN